MSNQCFEKNLQNKTLETLHFNVQELKCITSKSKCQTVDYSFFKIIYSFFKQIEISVNTVFY